ncbi:MAG: DUF2536 family protein [Alkalicoccus sp.]|nr:MAG: DUF2536 family protein [Alkalicoccus sp.]
MILRPDAIHDKVEFFEAENLQKLEEKIQQKIDINADLLLEVYHVTYQMVPDAKTGRNYATASVHFKQRSSR